jgi:hypothetical protein
MSGSEIISQGINWAGVGMWAFVLLAVLCAGLYLADWRLVWRSKKP